MNHSSIPLPLKTLILSSAEGAAPQDEDFLKLRNAAFTKKRKSQ
ncbi:hypothetical protein Msil_3491 [Methylocella silvestris BL2]|uniref:Uncharacterized protein n=1 Tax=Methylocella silvestris (strain DSM 15510 / CIP 108128 / LMG 27833 / NCIMB 13906 / BL2) TaxID=395965 RepID=B8ETM8_METSB|nr:hypothetical protein Msil_3491 [Methylocella silvestris BL2]